MRRWILRGYFLHFSVTYYVSSTKIMCISMLHRLKVFFSPFLWGWSGGAKVLGKLSVPGRPTSLDDSRARAYCSCSRCGWGLLGHLFSHLSFLFFLFLSLGDGPI